MPDTKHSNVHLDVQEFPTFTQDDWMGRSVGEKAEGLAHLVRRTEGGLARGPLFTAHDRADADGVISRRHPANAGELAWDVRALVDLSDPKDANALALDELKGAATSLALVIDPDSEAGLALKDSADLETTLSNVFLDIAPVSLTYWKERDASRQAAFMGAEVMFSVWDARGLAPGAVRGALNLAPFDAALVLGANASGAHIDHDCAQSLYFLEQAQNTRPNVHVFVADGCFAHELGADEVLELAWTAACVAAYCRLAHEHDHSANVVAPRIQLALAATPDVHLTIAKLRAARRVFARIAAAFGGEADAQIATIEAWTSGRMLQADDAWTNQIRTACAVLGAGVGGADAIVALPFTQPLGKATETGRRIARNQHLIALMESHLGAVDDPAAGSFTHEALTDRLARAAWEKFQAIETGGGALAYALSGQLSDEIAAVREAREARMQAGDDVVVGVNRYQAKDIPTPEVAK